MKRLFLIAIAGFCCLLFQNVQATLLFEDGFNYSAGGLNASDSSPAGFSGNAWSAGSSHIAVISGNLTYSGLEDLGGNMVTNAWGISAGSVINTYTAQSGVGNSIYYSFLVQCIAAPAANTYLTSLNPGTTAPGGSADALAVYVNTLGGGWEVGLRTDGSSTVLASATPLTLNTTYLIVAEYTFGASGLGTANLFIDPTAGAGQPTANVTANNTVSVSSIADLGFKAQSTAGDFLLDNVLVGTTWADVTPTAAPEPSTIALSGIALAGLAFRRRWMRK